MTVLEEQLKLGSFVVIREAAMSKEQCGSSLAAAEGKLTPSGLVGEQRDEYRTSSDAWPGPGETGSAQAAMRQLVVEITGLPKESTRRASRCFVMNLVKSIANTKIFGTQTPMTTTPEWLAVDSVHGRFWSI